MKESKTLITPSGKFTSHSINMTDRKKASLTGVIKVEGASPTELALTTCLGKLVVTGTELQIVKFDDADGNLSLTGNVDCIKYTQGKQSLIKRIFK